MAEGRRALFTWVGQRAPLWQDARDGREKPGPILALLNAEGLPPLTDLYLFFTLGGAFAESATLLYRHCERRFPRLRVHPRPVELASVVDRSEIYRRMNREWQALRRELGQPTPEILVYLSPGTPQMQTVWVLLVQAGLLPARLIEAPDPLYDPQVARTGRASWFAVDLNLPDFPQVSSPGELE